MNPDGTMNENCGEFKGLDRFECREKVVEYLENQITKEEMIEKIKKESRHYAKRQLTWFRKDKDFKWLNSEEEIENNINIILGVV